MKEFLKKWLSLKERDFKSTMWLISLSFLLGLCVSVYLISSQTLFLKQYGAEKLPVAFIFSGIAGLVVWYITNFIDQRANFRIQVMAKTVIIVLSIIVLSIFQNYNLYEHTSFLIFVWFRVIIYLAVIVLWSLANRIFNIESAKSVFPVIALGEGIAYMIGFFFTSLILSFVSLNELLYVSSGLAFLALIAQNSIYVIHRESILKVNTKKVEKTNDKKSNRSEKIGITKMLSDSYLGILFSLALLPIFSRFFIDFLFLDKVNTLFTNPNSIANFLALFFGFTSIIEMLLKSTLASRFYNKYGVSAGIILFPALIIIGIALALLFNIISQSVLLLFSMIALSRLIERTIRSSFYDTSFQILYQPIPADIRSQVQNSMEGIPKTLGTILAGVIIFVISTIGGTLGNFSFNFMLLLFLGILVFWLIITMRLRVRYPAQLRSAVLSLTNATKKSKRIKVEEKEDNSVFDFLNGATVKEDAHLRFSYEKFKEAISKEVDIKKLDKHDLIEIGMFSSNYNLFKLSLYQVPQGVYPRIIPRFSDALLNPFFFPFAYDILYKLPTGYRSTIENYIKGDKVKISVKFHYFMYLITNYNDSKIDKLIEDELRSSRHNYEFLLIFGLLEQKHRIDIDRIRYIIREKVDYNIGVVVRFMQYYIDLISIEIPNHLDHLLIKLIELHIGNILNLCALLFDKVSIKVARDIILKGRSQSTGNMNEQMLAVEIMDSTIDSEMKSLLMPIISGQSYHDIIKHFQLSYPQKRCDVEDRLRYILNDPMTLVPVSLKIEAINLIDKLNLELTSVVTSMLTYPNNRIKAMAANILKTHLSEEDYNNTIKRIGITHIDDIGIPYDEMTNHMISFLKNSEKYLNEYTYDDFDALQLLETVEVKTFKKNESIPYTSMSVLEGKITTIDKTKSFETGDMFLTFSQPIEDRAHISFVSEDESKVIIINEKTLLKVLLIASKVAI